jgi:hypothetical protein
VLDSDVRESEINKEPVTGPHRARLSSAVYGKGDQDKRKRSRVTPDQLVHLEPFFTVDRSPTTARRREISELLGMQERQMQTWFQNRSLRTLPSRFDSSDRHSIDGPRPNCRTGETNGAAVVLIRHLIRRLSYLPVSKWNYTI